MSANCKSVELNEFMQWLCLEFDGVVPIGTYGNEENTSSITIDLLELKKLYKRIREIEESENAGS